MNNREAMQKAFEANYKPHEKDFSVFDVDDCKDYTNPNTEKAYAGFVIGYQAALASQAQQSQWISVEERLPESKNEVLVFEKSNNVSFSFFDGKAWFINEYERNYGYIQRKLPDGLVTYWMPLPPAPEGGDK